MEILTLPTPTLSFGTWNPTSDSLALDYIERLGRQDSVLWGMNMTWFSVSGQNFTFNQRRSNNYVGLTLEGYQSSLHIRNRQDYEEYWKILAKYLNANGVSSAVEERNGALFVTIDKSSCS